MGLVNWLKGQFIDIVEWLDDSKDTMVHRFDRKDNEIKYGAQLVVRESQVAVFVNMGKIADVFKPGMYTLDTKNLPILSDLMGWKYGFESPFKAEVYFVSTRNFTDLKWGTKNPVMLRDAEFGPVRLRAFGTYVVKVVDAAAFIREIAGTEGTFTTDGITEQLRDIVVSRFADALGESKLPILDLAANYDELGIFVTKKIAVEFVKYGLDLTKLLVENISLPTEVEAALDKRASMGVLGDLNKFAQFQAANAMEAAAANPGGGGASEGMGLGMGFAMAGQMARTLGQAAAPVAGGPPPVPSEASYFAALSGKQAGPFALDALELKAKTGELTRDTLVWKQGMAAWTKAGDVFELAQLFAPVPPPLP